MLVTCDLLQKPHHMELSEGCTNYIPVLPSRATAVAPGHTSYTAESYAPDVEHSETVVTPKQRSIEPGIKHDGGKIRTDLLPVYPMLEEARVLTRGAIKYGDRNWEAGFSWSRAYGALLRHLFAFWQGEDLDPESGLQHLAHAACELDFLIEFYRTHPEFDDRPKGA